MTSAILAYRLPRTEPSSQPPTPPAVSSRAGHLASSAKGLRCGHHKMLTKSRQLFKQGPLVQRQMSGQVQGLAFNSPNTHSRMATMSCDRGRYPCRDIFSEISCSKCAPSLRQAAQRDLGCIYSGFAGFSAPGKLL